MAVERGLGSGSCLGDSRALLPAAHCTSAFPSKEANSQSWAGAQGWSKITCTAESLCQQICWPTPISFSLPHILPFQHCHGRAGTQPSAQRDTRDAAVTAWWQAGSSGPQDWGPHSHGMARHPRVPQAKDRFNFQTASAQSEEKREHNRGRAEREFPVPRPTSCLPGPLH